MSYADRRAERRAAREQRQQDVHQTLTQREADIAVLRTMGWNDFATSLVSQFDRKGYLSDKQWPWVSKLAAEQRERDLDRDLERKGGSSWNRNQTGIEVPATAALFAPDRWSRFNVEVDGLELSYRRKNDGSCAWLKVEGTDGVVGRLDLSNDTLAVFAGKCRKAGVDPQAVRDAAEWIEQDPQRAAEEHGILTNRCCACNRELTNPESIARHMGPICAGRVGW